MVLVLSLMMLPMMANLKVSNTAEDEDDAKASEGDVEFKRVGVA